MTLSHKMTFLFLLITYDLENAEKLLLYLAAFHYLKTIITLFAIRPCRFKLRIFPSCAFNRPCTRIDIWEFYQPVCWLGPVSLFGRSECVHFSAGMDFYQASSPKNSANEIRVIQQKIIMILIIEDWEQTQECRNQGATSNFLADQLNLLQRRESRLCPPITTGINIFFHLPASPELVRLPSSGTPEVER